MSDFAPGVERARAAGYQINVSAYPEDIEEGIEESLETIAGKIREGRMDPDVRGWAADVLMAAGRPSSVRDRMAALLEAFRAATMYLPDPLKTEMIVSARTTVCLRPGLCVRGRDCDDGVVMIGSAGLAIGIPIVAVRQYFGPDRQNHVLLEAQDENGQWFAVDPATDLPVGQKVAAWSEERIDPLELVGAGGTAGYELVTVGGVGLGSAPMVATRREMHFDGRRWHERRYGTEWVRDGDVWIEERPIERPAANHNAGLGAVTNVIDVFVYRRLWDSYVLGMARAANACAAAWRAQASGQTPSTPLATGFENPAAAADGAAGLDEVAQRILDRWNAFAGWTSADILAASDQILASEQDVVLRCAQFWGPNILRYCPQIELPTTPSLDLQQQVIAYLEAGEVVAKGTLQLLAVGAQGAAQTYENLAEKASTLADKLLDNTPYIAGAIVVVAAAYMAFLIVPEFRAARSAARKAA